MKQKTVVALVTGAALVAPIRKMAEEILPNIRFICVLDDSLISDVISAGEMTTAVLERIHQYCNIGAGMGADIILETCSSVGESVDFIQPFFSIPVLRIDQCMVDSVLEKANRIGVLATLPTTLDPTMRLVEKTALRLGKEVSLVNGLAQGAFEALTSGDAAGHDRILLETAKKVASSCEHIILAQGSMARMEDSIQKATGIPVSSSLKSGLESLRNYL